MFDLIGKFHLILPVLFIEIILLNSTISARVYELNYYANDK